jgi:hypothetical protein
VNSGYAFTLMNICQASGSHYPITPTEGQMQDASAQPIKTDLTLPVQQ